VASNPLIGSWLAANRIILCEAAGRADDIYGPRGNWTPRMVEVQRHFLVPGSRLVERIKERRNA
jgi:hypothetical protein